MRESRRPERKAPRSREYREYSGDEQRSGPGCIGTPMYRELTRQRTSRRYFDASVVSASSLSTSVATSRSRPVPTWISPKRLVRICPFLSTT